MGLRRLRGERRPQTRWRWYLPMLRLNRAHNNSAGGGPPGWAQYRGRLMLGVVLHAGDVHDHHWVVAHHPGVMARRDPGNISRTKLLLAAIVHDHMQAARDVVLQVRGLAALSLHERFDARGPFPAGLQSRAPEGHVVDRYQFYLALVERARLVRTSLAATKIPLDRCGICLSFAPRRTARSLEF